VHPDLDAWLPDPQVRTLHRRSAEVDADRLWHATQTIRLSDAPRLGRAVRWRIPGTSSELSFRDLFRQYPFAVLAEGPHSSVSGMCGRIWTIRRDYPHIQGGDEFLEWREPGTVRVILAHWIERAGAGTSLVSEARIKPVDGGAALRLRALWAVMGRFERLIGGEVLRAAVERADMETG
jgi:hypothetical protein